MRLTVESDGTFKGTKICCGEEQLEGVIFFMIQGVEGEDRLQLRLLVHANEVIVPVDAVEKHHSRVTDTLLATDDVTGEEIEELVSRQI